MYSLNYHLPSKPTDEIHRGWVLCQSMHSIPGSYITLITTSIAGLSPSSNAISTASHKRIDDAIWFYCKACHINTRGNPVDENKFRHYIMNFPAVFTQYLCHLSSCFSAEPGTSVFNNIVFNLKDLNKTGIGGEYTKSITKQKQAIQTWK